jgi:GH43 family beta-xylosidase
MGPEVDASPGRDEDTGDDEQPNDERPSGDASQGDGDDSGPDAGRSEDSDPDAGEDASTPARPDAGSSDDAGTPDPNAKCVTRIQYGSSWFHPGNHADDFDIAKGDVRWDGSCVDDGDNSYAVLSNGWKPRFQGHASCVMAIDHENCVDAATTCSTRIAYGDSWQAPQGHNSHVDEVKNRVTWNGACEPTGQNSFAQLSNGWKPHFDGANACRMGFAYEECGGLYTNQLFNGGCPDPGVLKEGDSYFVYCTGNGFNIYETTDLVHYTKRGQIFPSGSRPAWIKNSYWAPEVHKIGGKFVAYFTGRDQTDRLTIGMAVADDPLGPFTDHGGPFVRDADMGMIDANAFADADGHWYLVWKADGNAAGKPTPIYGQALSADGRTLVGDRKTLISNDLSWEGHVVEGPFVIRHGAYYYMFYSGNAYYNASYAVGVARASSPLGPYTKHGDPILTSNQKWSGPGHCSVVDGPKGDTWMVYHSWLVGEVGSGHARQLLVDPVDWKNDWPIMPEAPSIRSVPIP